ncbi:MAG: hypothetical protein KF762_02455 [Acidobacteria bacterium]|nr:hypothetical protein [Acidobacteriota bacterium]
MGMLYRPKYCCNCGERIERAEWGVLTSRRFCDFCSTENMGSEWAGKGILALALVLGVFGFASILGGAGKGYPAQVEPPSATAEKRFLKPLAAKTKSGEQTSPADQVPESAVPTQAFVAPAEPVKAAPAAAKFFCGYPTKKGTPCSRKVKVKGAKCYQHDGLELHE